MKIRNGNVFTKEPFIPHSEEHLAVLAEKRRIHRLFNPKQVKEDPDELTLLIRKRIKELRDFKRSNHIAGVKITNSPYFVFKTKKRTDKVSNKTKHVNLKPNKPSMPEQNRCVMVKLGYKPKQSDLRRKTKREIQRAYIKIGRGSTDGLCCKQRRYKMRKSIGRHYTGIKKKVA